MEELSEETKITRRSALERGLKKAAVVGASAAVVVGGGVEILEETMKGVVGVITPETNFRPLYERHDLGIDVKDIPNNLDIYFREWGLIRPDGVSALFDESAEAILYSEASTVYEGTEIEAQAVPFPPELRSALADRDAELMLGDVYVGDLYTTNPTSQLPYRVALGAGSLLNISAALSSKKMSRRAFMGAVGTTGIAWGMTGMIRRLTDIWPVTTKQQDAKKRLKARIEGISTDLHPEQIGLFFRNLVMADKLLEVASQTHSEKGNKKPQLAFQVEVGHSGIEDFLEVGPETCRKLILSYPTEVLREVVRLNDGVENFCSSRLFKLQKVSNKVRVVSERKVTDKILKAALEKKLS